MRPEIEKYELIEKFLSGTLTESENAEIEKRIQTDREFAEEVSDQRQIFSFIEKSAGVGIKDQIRSIHENTVYRKIRYRTIRNILIAAIGIAFTAILLYYLFTNDKKTKENIVPVHVQEIIAGNAEQQINFSNNQEVTEHKNLSPKRKETNIPQSDLPVTDSVSGDSKTMPEDVALVPEKYVPLHSSVPEVTGAEKEIKNPEPLIHFDCSGIFIEAVVQTSSSCNNEPTGEIHIEESTISGGTMPYEISIDNSQTYNNLLRQKSLMPGSYSVWIRDGNECRTWLGNFSINSVDCIIEDVFAPSKGEKWKIPNREQPCSLRIFKLNGTIVYESYNDFPGTYYWDGSDMRGDLVSMGVYSFILTFTDQLPVQGTVTVVK